MDKYPPGITTPYSYPRQKNNLTGSPIYTGGYGFTPMPIPTWVWIYPHTHTHTHVGMGHPSGYQYPEKLNIYQNIILYKYKVYPSKYHYKISSII
jgi:hypothetical protein